MVRNIRYSSKSLYLYTLRVSLFFFSSSLSPPLSLHYLHSFSGQVIYSNRRKLRAISKMLLALNLPPMVFHMPSACSRLECTSCAQTAKSHQLQNSSKCPISSRKLSKVLPNPNHCFFQYTIFFFYSTYPYTIICFISNSL